MATVELDHFLRKKCLMALMMIDKGKEEALKGSGG